MRMALPNKRTKRKTSRKSSGKRNVESKSTNDCLEVDCTKFEEKTVRLYLDFVHNIKQGQQEMEFEQLIELIKFLVDMGKTGNDSEILLHVSVLWSTTNSIFEFL